MIDNEKLMEKNSDNHQNMNVNKENIYYAVYVPDETERAKHVYSDKNEALRAVKEHQGSRFKLFKKLADAEKFALYGQENSIPASPIQSTTISEEKLNNFKAPRSLVVFRKLIESGNLEEVEKIIWENPRYIITSCDTPTILQEGCRYNAMHIATRSTHPAKVCELILNTVTNKKFLQLFYGDQKDETYSQYSELLIDRFINTPDKALNETPLHFASKFGLKDMVQILVSYPQCIKTLPNKHGQTPIEIICSRKNQNEKIKLEINALLQEQYYVPVLRSVDNTLQPMIGEPFSLRKPPVLNIDPMSPPVEVRAFAGPMPKEKANEFRKKWKTPPRCHKLVSPNACDNNTYFFTNAASSPVLNLTSRLQDTEKGLERVGRDLAEEQNVSWKEYWSFLNDFANLRNKDDLKKLEAYLKSKMSCPPVFCYGDESDENKNEKTDIKNTTLDEINNLCEKFQATKLFDEDSDDSDEDTQSIFFTPPTSPLMSSDDSSDDDMQMAEEGKSTYIRGEQATKLDYAVYTAIPQDIDSEEFPYIYFWKHDIEILIQQNYRFVGKTPARTRPPFLHDRPLSQLKPLRIDFNAE